MAELWTQVRLLAPYARTLLLSGPADAGQDAVAQLLLEFSAAPSRPVYEWEIAKAELELARPDAAQALPAEALLHIPEVHQLSLEAQGGLLRLLRWRRPKALTVVLSSSADLRVQVSLGRFCAELWELISTACLTLPPLRNRKEDLPMLLNQMLTAKCAPSQGAKHSISDGLLRAAMEHSWPGNLRELESVVDQLSKIAPARELTAEDLQQAIGSVTAPRPVTAQVRMIALETVVQEHIQAVLQACRGNKLRAAETLGISRSTLYRMLDSPTASADLRIAS